jgi:pimeloyl-ACP methyl ester carboxylesterase
MPWQYIHGLEIYYEVSGSGPPVMLIHGLGSSLQDWENQIPILSKKFQVITVDLRGHGKSGRHTGPFTITQFAEDTAALLGKIGAEPVNLVGISMGGMVAFQLSLDCPDLVEKLVVVNTLPEVNLSSLRARWEIGQRYFLTRLLGMRLTGRILSRRVFPDFGHEELRNKFAFRWAQNDPDVYMATVRGILGWSVQERLGSIQCPTLVVAGENDFIPLEAKKSFMRQIPESMMKVMPGSGHASPADRPEEFNRIVLDFLGAEM